MTDHIGEIASLLTALCWTVSAISFELASKKAGSLAVNFIRLFFALGFLCTYTYFNRGQLLPLDAPHKTWIWLTISGIIGFVVGDYLLFRAFVLMGSRTTMLIMTLVPLFATLLGRLIMSEQLTGLSFIGMGITISGIALVLQSKKSIRFKSIDRPVLAILCAVGAAVGQAGGLVLSKYGMGEYDAFAATQIRVLAGIGGFFLIILTFNKWSLVQSGLKNRGAMIFIIMGAVFGPFLGVAISLYAVQHTVTGVASTIMAIVPILIIPPTFFIFKQKITLLEIIGAIISVAGVVILFYN